jgi:predicted amidohydrolase YtcJ
MDLIVYGGPVLTMDPARPRAEAVAIRGNTIAAVGSTVDMLALKTPGTRPIDAQGGTILPGLIEAHMHLFAGAFELSELSLFGDSA